MYTPVFIEYLGTCLIIGAFVFTSSPLFVVAALATAIGLGGKISGGHFNPAITAWALSSGKINNSKALMYWIAQFGAGLTIWIVGSMIKA
jgi:glycerol uptake facilitator-like aquaporin